MASGPMKRSRVAGATKRLNLMAPTVCPSELAAKITPTAAAPPPRADASGAATPSGAL